MGAIARVRLLGRFVVEVDGSPATVLRSARAESLLAFLLLHGERERSREQVASLLWPDSGDAQARTNLRHLLHTLRHDLPCVDVHLELTGRTVRWRAEPPVAIDVVEFDRLLDSPAGDADARRTALIAAVGLYRGELLDGCDDEWIRAERERLRRRHLEALSELAALHEAAGEPEDAAAAAERVLDDDPLREDAHRVLIRVCLQRGDRAGAVRAYHRCATTLERELAVEPSGPTQRLYREMLTSGRETSPRPGPRTRRPPLVGRAAEGGVLRDAWRGAAAGSARLVFVTGEAGIGKSRLVEDLRDACARLGATAVEARCYAAEGPLAYGPIADWLRQPAVRQTLPSLDRVRLTELARLLPELIDEMPGLPPPVPLPEHEQRHRLFEAVSAAVLGHGRPVLLVVEDLPHSDRDTCRLLHYLSRRPQARLLVVATARAEDRDVPHLRELLAGARERNRLTEIELAGFSRDETGSLVEQLTGARPGSAATDRLHRETGGNPLFVVEALRAGDAAEGRLTPRVQAVIAARLAQLDGPAREVVAVAAVIGREFTDDVLSAAADLDEDALVHGLDELWRRGIVRDRDAGGTYDFGHDRIREVAYASVGPARRRLLHRRVAAALENVHDRAPAVVSAQVAAHYERAGAPAAALAWFRRAAEAAGLFYADARSLELYERALSLLHSRPPSPERDAEELDLRVATLVPLLAIEGYASAGMTAALDRATELARSLRVEPAPPLRRALAVEALTRADFTTATHHGDLLRAAGERAGDDILVVEAAYVQGIAAFWQAELEPACRHFERAVARYRP
ncbi:MAG: AAA family ATPase, partial [Actinomycetota bacterium]|nr:AAA family ATPase [Actinomycetota bacterium]